MAGIVYKIDSPKNFSETERKTFRDLLEKQGKVKNPTIDKVNRCTFLCVCKADNFIVSIGAIKPKTNNDFNPGKANLDKLRNDFQLELGYCYTLPGYTGNGYSSKIVEMLIDKTAGNNIMASTELRDDNSMKRILERNNFKLQGNPWTSSIHGGQLGLFLNYAK
jgi:hypothetical protein